MDKRKLLQITGGVAIPLAELHFRFSRSGGPGGQNVNRVETRVELLFDLLNSAGLTGREKAQILDRLKGYVDKEGILHLFAQSARSQLQNREEAIARFRKLLAFALRPRKARRPTRPGPAARERRLRAKRGRSERKRQRERPKANEE